MFDDGCFLIGAISTYFNTTNVLYAYVYVDFTVKSPNKVKEW